MPYADDLLEQAHHLAKRERKKPRQASLRRAVSTAYSALFHLLISEATRNWRRAGQRPWLARFFEHGRMKAASDKQRGECNRFMSSDPPPVPGPQRDCMEQLLLVADTFFQAQQQRHTADYDNAKQWTRTETLELIQQVTLAFHSWRAVRDQSAAQDYLLSLLGTPRGI